MEIKISNPRKVTLPVTCVRVKCCANIFIKHSRKKFNALSIVFLDGSCMRRLNRERLGHDFVTDVITFDLRDNAAMPIDAEIFICPAEARRNARIYKEAVGRELLRYLAHGILHLLGYDDATVQERDRMRLKEDEMLSWLSSRRKL